MFNKILYNSQKPNVNEQAFQLYSQNQEKIIIKMSCLQLFAEIL